MHLLALVRHWLESLPGFIGLEAQTLTLPIPVLACDNAQQCPFVAFAAGEYRTNSPTFYDVHVRLGLGS